ncbi:MAG: SRPBCC domain-containing protein [Candidatus Solibacter sp.]
MRQDERITITTVVRAAPDAAFRLFTEEIDAWWRRGKGYRLDDGVMRFDGGQLLQGEALVGRVLAWEPGVRLLIEWHLWNFRAGERTEVEVRFQAVGDGTRVTVEHRGWEGRGEAFQAVVGLWWGPLLAALRAV